MMSPMIRFIGVLAVASLIVIPGIPRTTAQSQEPSGAPEALLEEGRRLFHAFQYDQAVPLFDRVIAALTTAGAPPSPDLLVQAYQLRARARFALEDTPGSESDFASLLAIRPGFSLGPEISPRVVGIFEAVRRRTVGQLLLAMTPAIDITIDGRPYTAQQVQQPIDLVSGTHFIAAARPGYRSISQSVEIPAGDRAALTVAMERISATLAVTTIPDGVEVVLDGVSRGVTAAGEAGSETSAPLVVGDLMPGAHRLQLRRVCYTSLERQITIEKPDDLWTDPLRLAPAIASVNIQTAGRNATIYVDGTSHGPAPAELNRICEGPHVIEVRSSNGRFVDRRDWRAGDTVTLEAELKPAFAIVAAAVEVGGPPPAELKMAVERALGSAAKILIFVPLDPELEAAMRDENIPADWLATDSTSSAAARRSAELRREIGRKLASRLDVQGLAAVGPSQDPDVVSVALLAKGSGVPDVLTFSLSDAATRTRVIEALGTPLPKLVKPSLETSTIDLGGTPGAAVVRVGAVGAQAGLALGDIITSVGDAPVGSVSELRSRIGSTAPGSQLPLEARSLGGSVKRLTATTAPVADTIPLRDSSLIYNRLLLELQDYARVAKDPIEQAAARLNLAIVHMRLENWDEAVQELQEVKLPDVAGVSAGTVAYLTGLSLEALGRTADAQAAFARAAEAQSRLSEDGPAVAPLAQQKLRRQP